MAYNPRRTVIALRSTLAPRIGLISPTPAWFISRAGDCVLPSQAVIATEVHAGIPVVRLDRPDQRNAMVPAMLSALVAQLHALAAGGRPIILTGSGRSFCAGADLTW